MELRGHGAAVPGTEPRRPQQHGRRLAPPRTPAAILLQESQPELLETRLLEAERVPGQVGGQVSGSLQGTEETEQPGEGGSRRGLWQKVLYPG